MVLKVFVFTSAAFGIPMALAFALLQGAVGVGAGLAAGVIFGLFMTLVLGGMHRAFGNTSVSASRTLTLPNAPEEAFEAARAAVLKAGCRDISESGRSLQARMPWSWRSFGERLTVEVGVEPKSGSALVVRSCPRVRTTLVDYGKNQANVDAVASYILELLRARTPTR